MKIAITGSIGSGKSTVCDYLRSKGYDVFDCDKYNAYLLEQGNEGYLKVQKSFPEVFVEDNLDKKKLASIIFNDVEKKKLLESILHPLIIEKMLDEAKKYGLFFAEVPLLFENNLDYLFDDTLLIVVDEQIALNRLVERGLSKEEAIKRLQTQMSVENKMLRAKQIIYNNSTLSDLYDKVDEWLKCYVGQGFIQNRIEC